MTKVIALFFILFSTSAGLTKELRQCTDYDKGAYESLDYELGSIEEVKKYVPGFVGTLLKRLELKGVDELDRETLSQMLISSEILTAQYNYCYYYGVLMNTTSCKVEVPKLGTFGSSEGKQQETLDFNARTKHCLKIDAEVESFRQKKEANKELLEIYQRALEKYEQEMRQRRQELESQEFELWMEQLFPGIRQVVPEDIGTSRT